MLYGITSSDECAMQMLEQFPDRAALTFDPMYGNCMGWSYDTDAYIYDDPEYDEHFRACLVAPGEAGKSGQ